MKKSFMHNLKIFVDSNVRHRIDRVSHHSGNINSTGEPLHDDLQLVERHFDDIQVFCVDAEKKISNLLQSIQLSSTNPSNLGTYTQNVQAGLNNISQNIAQQAANITSSASSISGFGHQATHDNKNLPNKESKSALVPNQCSQQYCSSESLSKYGQNQRSHTQGVTNLNPPIDHHVSEDVLQRYKKLPIVGFYKFINKSSRKLKQSSLLAITLTHYSQLQAQLTNLYLTYEQMIDSQCLKTIQQMLESDIPNVLKLKKSFLKAHNDLESLRAKFNGASQKQQQQQAAASGHFTNTSYLISQNSILQGNKLEQLKNELDEAVTKFEQARDIYETELYGFVCREPELVNLMRLFFHLEAEYYQKVSSAIQSSSPDISNTLSLTPRKFAFGTPLEEHLRCTGRTISPVIELCTHFLHLQALKEEGLFRIPGSSIKIKKLKNGINAWFVTLMNLDESESGAQQCQTSGQACITALHDLFKNSIGQRPQTQRHQSDSSDVGAVTRSVSIAAAGDDSALSRKRHATSLSSDESYRGESNNDDYILDVHSIAGLLKLYLREMPEPLFTHALYDNWIACISSETDSASRLERLAKVMEQLPTANYENLKHLVKFLRHLTLFQEQNKMSSTNLAIAMAPSLIWSKPADHKETQLSNSVSSSDDAQSLNLQMSSFGMSASQHATIIEALINNADQLFPEPSDYSLSEFKNLTLECKRVKDAGRGATAGRSVKSTSPTGLSTASSSSFSSTTSNSTGSSTANKGHHRKGGSMEGLLGGPQDITKVIQQNNMSVRSIGRPASVQIRHNDYSTLIRVSQASPPLAGPAPPAKPPVPSARSHSRPNPHETAAHNTPSFSSNKARAPPVPPPTSVRHQQERLKASVASAQSNQESLKPRPVSLRGTGTLDAAAPGQQQAGVNQSVANATARPSVPPPERPATSALISDSRKTVTTTDRKCKSVDDSDTKSSHSLSSSGHMRAGDFEEISANEVEEIDLSTQSNSPVVSLDSISGDSSFDNDNDNTSLDRSWTKCFTTKQTKAGSGQGGDRDGSNDNCDDDDENRSGTLKLIVRDMASAASDTSETTKSIRCDRAQVQSNGNVCVSSGNQPPAKPPRSASPKITQSTPL